MRFAFVGYYDSSSLLFYHSCLKGLLESAGWIYWVLFEMVVPSEKFSMYLGPIYHVIAGCSKWQYSDENRSTQGQLYWYVIRGNIECVIAPNFSALSQRFRGRWNRRIFFHGAGVFLFLPLKKIFLCIKHIFILYYSGIFVYSNCMYVSI
jgi:hypothetical protein